MKTSFTIITRDRISLLKNCIDSIKRLASKDANYEIIIVIDDDDESFKQFPLSDYSDLDIRVYPTKRSHFFQRDYNNFATEKTTGDVVWGLNDDCEIGTENWDLKLNETVELIREQQSDDIFYLGMNDGTHGEGTKHEQQPSCCFPILSKAACNAMQAFMPDEINMWGADIALYNIFSYLSENRIYFCDELKVIHNSVHSIITHREKDSGYDRAELISKKTTLNFEEYMKYVSRLEQAIGANNE